ncbi:MAG: hypothetical protein ACHQU1_05965 [Gemmatimonadales bacterium]
MILAVLAAALGARNAASQVSTVGATPAAAASAVNVLSPNVVAAFRGGLRVTAGALPLFSVSLDWTAYPTADAYVVRRYGDTPGQPLRADLKVRDFTAASGSRHYVAQTFPNYPFAFRVIAYGGGRVLDSTAQVVVSTGQATNCEPGAPPVHGIICLPRITGTCALTSPRTIQLTWSAIPPNVAFMQVEAQWQNGGFATNVGMVNAFTITLPPDAQLYWLKFSVYGVYQLGGYPYDYPGQRVFQYGGAYNPGYMHHLDTSASGPCVFSQY